MDKKAVLQKLKADISTYNDFSEIKYKPKYVSVFEAVLGKEIILQLQQIIHHQVMESKAVQK